MHHAARHVPEFFVCDVRSTRATKRKNQSGVGVLLQLKRTLYVQRLGETGENVGSAIFAFSLALNACRKKFTSLPRRICAIKTRESSKGGEGWVRVALSRLERYIVRYFPRVRTKYLSEYMRIFRPFLLSRRQLSIRSCVSVSYPPSLSLSLAFSRVSVAS